MQDFVSTLQTYRRSENTIRNPRKSCQFFVNTTVTAYGLSLLRRGIHQLCTSPGAVHPPNYPVQPLTVQSAVQAVTVYSAVQALTVYSAVQPLTVYSAVQPLTVYNAVQPLTVYCPMQPMTGYSGVQPLTGHSAVQPQTVQRAVQPLCHNAQYSAAHPAPKVFLVQPVC